MARRQDGLTVQINVCEHPDPVGEMRRIYNTISETLGFRTLQQETGNDVFQLKLMLHALGFFRPDEGELATDDRERNRYTQEAVDAVDRFRSEQGWRTSVPGFVDAQTVATLWSQLEEVGKANDMRQLLLEIQRIRR
jgi:murein L,D-transpeptidase YcbB/YkuD